MCLSRSFRCAGLRLYCHTGSKVRPAILELSFAAKLQRVTHDDSDTSAAPASTTVVEMELPPVAIRASVTQLSCLLAMHRDISFAQFWRRWHEHRPAVPIAGAARQWWRSVHQYVSAVDVYRERCHCTSNNSYDPSPFLDARSHLSLPPFQVFVHASPRAGEGAARFQRKRQRQSFVG